MPLLAVARPSERVIRAANSARVTDCEGEKAVSLVPVIISLDASRSIADFAQWLVISPNVLLDWTTV
ncbi:hypothetical protein D3C76_1866960 [compost metagenome]